LGHEERNALALALCETVVENPRGADVVDVLVGDEDRLDSGVTDASGLESSEDLTGREPAIYENPLAFIADIGAVPTGSGAQGHDDGVLVEEGEQDWDRG